MPDPFEALRTAPTPIDPDPAFAARLRGRLVRALSATSASSEGDQTMTLQIPETATDRLRQGDISYCSLWVPDVARAADFYAAVLGWTYGANPAGPFREVQDRPMAQGINELRASGEYLRELGVPLRQMPSPTAYVVFVVDDLDAGIQRVRDSGGWAGDAKEQPYGRVSACIDNQGMTFSLHEVPVELPAPRPPASGAREGDIAYLVFEVPDSAQARAFYGSVLGLAFAPGRSEDGWNIADMMPMSGLSGGNQQSTIVPMYRVNDIHAVVERVRAAGGTAGDPVIEPYGTRAECADDQGMRFLLGQF